MKASLHLGEASLATVASESRPPTPREARHLSGCTGCTAKLEASRRLIQLLRAHPDEGERPPAELLERAAGLLGRVRPDPVSPGRVLASARQDDAAAAPSGIRSAAAGTHWLFAAGELETDLELVAEAPDGHRVRGQVQGPDGAACGLPVHLRHEGPARTTVTGPRGEFVFPQVRGASVHLLLETDTGVYRLDLSPGARGSASDGSPRAGGSASGPDKGTG